MNLHTSVSSIKGIINEKEQIHQQVNELFVDKEEVIKKLGLISINNIPLCEGMELVTNQFNLKTSLSITRTLELDSKLSGYIFCTQGRVKINHINYSGNQLLKRNDGVIFIINNEIEKIDIPENEQISTVMLYINPSMVKQYLQKLEKDLPLKVIKSIREDNDFNFRNDLRLTAGLNNIINQILYCPYQGKMKSFFLEGKSIELLILFLNQLSEVLKVDLIKKNTLDLQDIKRMHRAREILLNNLAEPTKISTLASMVGTNECYLKKQFKQVFGLSVFAYFQKARMEKARILLLNKALSVSEAAQTLGYTSVSYFTIAFRKHFGYNPSDIKFSY
ncbi:MAG: AraC family transcriptional regulator [Bacteroidota bacterium]